MSNFAFLGHPQWAFLFESAKKAEELAKSDARGSCFYARRTLELAVAWLYKHERQLRLPYQDNLSALIHEPTFRQTVGDALFTKARLIKDLGNMAVHSTKRMAPSDAVNATRELFHFGYWLARTYGRTGRPNPSLQFDLGMLPDSSVAPSKTAEQLQRLEADLQAKDERLSVLLADKAALDDELKKLREQVAATKQANSTQPDTHDYSEAETRKTFIDVLLKEAGWDLDPAKNFEVEVTGMPNAEGKGFVDYVLWGDDGKPLALIEAKRTTKNPNVGQQQAKLYADCLEKMFGQRPVIFYSNGYEHWMWDDMAYPPRPVQGFYKKPELELAIQRRSSRKSLVPPSINEAIIERYYQRRAVGRIGESFQKDNQRKALVVMATGAGKTRTVIALADMLMRCNWAKRVLFLADRVALVNQAVNAFKAHLPDSSPVNLVTDKATEGRVYVSTYPTMMGLIDEAADGQRRFGVGHFDLIIIDEAHRSVYQKYRAIFDYFDSLLVGLTATPKDEIDHNTYGLFDLETGVPTDAYSLEEAVGDKHLVPPVAISVPLKFQREGIKYDELSDEEKEEWDAKEWTEDGSTPDEVGAEAVNKWLFNTDTVDKVLETLMTKGQKVAGGDRLGKTIIFAKNNDHADFIAQRFDANYPHYKGHFARIVTYKTEYAQSLIDAFSNKEKEPHIAISVDMLDTGIDVPEIVNLVFFKIVRSKTKFWQMIGRGTRLCKDLYGPDDDKKDFFVFDFCQNLEFFSQNPNVSDGSSAEPLGKRLFKDRLELIAQLDRKLVRGNPSDEESPPKDASQMTEEQVRMDTAALLHQVVANMRVENFVVRPQRQYVEKYAKESAWDILTPDDHLDLRARVAGLPSELGDDDEEAKRFDLLVLSTQLALLKASKDFASHQEKIQRIASALEEQANIPAIKAEIVLIQSIASDEWWEDITIAILEVARRKLRLLIKLIEKSKKKIVYTHFKDEIGEGTRIDLPQVTAGLDMIKFKEKARAFLKAHDSHLSLQRLRRNQQLTSTDIEELEKMLVQAGGTNELIEKAKADSHSLGIYIRSLVGLEPEAISEAFNQFLNGTSVTPNQIEFIQLIVQELTQNGVMTTARLFQSPFTDINASGPLGVFPPSQASAVVETLQTFWDRAVA